ncbi:hypothetical protein V502_06610 [Pseudogymnoascus sp. VKM F-4520 (FW-2644)]|nr:hypothetical protein V502_06610 [Pseudogymnoascus sp. VKM F-4520 (FW-2644)]
MAAELIGFGLSASDKLIDKHFDKIPDKITSPMGKDIPYITEKMHTQTGTNTEHNPHRRFRSPPPAPDSDPDTPYHSSEVRSRAHRDDRRPRREVARDRDGHVERQDRHRAADMRREDLSPRPRHTRVESPPPQRPGFVTRRSQSMRAPRRASRRGDERRGSRSRSRRRDRSGNRRRDSSKDRRRSRSKSSSSEGIAERFMDDPVARGAMGAAVGGVLAKQAVKAGDKWKDRGKGKGERKGKGHTDDDILVTLAGMALGGAGLLFAGDKYKEKKEREERERHTRGKARRDRTEGKRDEREKVRHTREWVEERRDGEVERYMREEKIAEEGRGGGFHDGRGAYDDVWRGHGYDDRRRER